MATETRDQQVKQVVEGLALGVLAIKVRAVSSSKMDLEFAFSHALRGWSCADRFPSLGGHDGANYLWIGMQKSERRRGVLAAWDSGRWMTPYIVMDEWSVEDCTEVLAEQPARVSHAGWVELGQLFVDRMGEANILREAE